MNKQRKLTQHSCVSFNKQLDMVAYTCWLQDWWGNVYCMMPSSSYMMLPIAYADA